MLGANVLYPVASKQECDGFLSPGSKITRVDKYFRSSFQIQIIWRIRIKIRNLSKLRFIAIII